MNGRYTYISLLALLLCATACTTGGNADGTATSPIAGVTQPKEPVIRRTQQKSEGKPHAQATELKSNFDFQLQVNGKTLQGAGAWACKLARADKGRLTLSGPKQEEIVLTYQLDPLHPQLDIPAGAENLQVDARLELLRGALVKHVVLSQAQSPMLGLWMGGSEGPFSITLPSGITLAQQPMDPRPIRTTKEANYHAVPVKVSGPGINLTLRPGEQKNAGGLTVQVLESEQRILNTSAPTAAADAEGPDHNYWIAIYK